MLAERPRLLLTEADLERFFGAPPARTDPVEVSWPYNGLSFDVERGPFRISCQLFASCGDIALAVRTSSGELLYELSATVVNELKMHPGPSHDTLEIVFSDGNRLLVRLDPCVLITQQAGDGT